MKTITLDYLKSINACYWERDGLSRIIAREYVEARLPATPLEVVDFDLPVADLLWLLLRRDFLPESTLRELARQFALAVVDNWDCPAVVRQWLETGDEAIRVEARSAADSAADSAYWWAARSAAESAARSADSAASSDARSAADLAASSDARSEARLEARSEAYSAARSAQLAAVKAKLRETGLLEV